MSSGQGWTRGAESAVPGQRRGDDSDRESPGGGNRGAWDPDDQGGWPTGDADRSAAADAEQKKSRWRDRGKSGRRNQPASDEVGEDDDYWSYLRGDRELSDVAGLGDPTAAGAAAPDERRGPDPDRPGASRSPGPARPDAYSASDRSGPSTGWYAEPTTGWRSEPAESRTSGSGDGARRPADSGDDTRPGASAPGDPDTGRSRGTWGGDQRVEQRWPGAGGLPETAWPAAGGRAASPDGPTGRAGPAGTAAWPAEDRTAAWPAGDQPAAWSGGDQPAAWPAGDQPAAWSGGDRPDVASGSVGSGSASTGRWPGAADGRTEWGTGTDPATGTDSGAAAGSGAPAPEVGQEESASGGRRGLFRRRRKNRDDTTDDPNDARRTPPAWNDTGDSAPWSSAGGTASWDGTGGTASWDGTGGAPPWEADGPPGARRPPASWAGVPDRGGPDDLPRAGEPFGRDAGPDSPRRAEPPPAPDWQQRTAAVPTTRWETGSDGGEFWPTADDQHDWSDSSGEEPPEWSVRRRHRSPDLSAGGPPDIPAGPAPDLPAGPAPSGSGVPGRPADLPAAGRFYTDEYPGGYAGDEPRTGGFTPTFVTPPGASGSAFSGPMSAGPPSAGPSSAGPSSAARGGAYPDPLFGDAGADSAGTAFRSAGIAVDPTRPAGMSSLGLADEPGGYPESSSRSAWGASRSTLTDRFTGTQPAVQPSVAFTGQQVAIDAEPPAAWRKILRSNRRAKVLPGVFVPVAATAVAALLWLAVVGYGVVRLHPLWSAGALVVGVGALALALRGRSVLGLLPVLVGAAAWGMATGDKVPPSFSDVLGDVKLVGWNVAYAVPLLVTYGCATWVTSTRYARDRVQAAIGERRWFGNADAPDGERRLAVMEAVPSVRFFQAPGSSSPHLVTAGRRVALVRSTVWPHGSYTATDVGEVHRNGRIYANGSDDLNGVVADVRNWGERLGSVASAGLGFLVVHPASDRDSDRVEVDMEQSRNVRVVHADRFVEEVGEFLAAEPYRLDVALTERLGEHLPIFDGPA